MRWPMSNVIDSFDHESATNKWVAWLFVFAFNVRPSRSSSGLVKGTCGTPVRIRSFTVCVMTVRMHRREERERERKRKREREQEEEGSPLPTTMFSFWPPFVYTTNFIQLFAFARRTRVADRDDLFRTRWTLNALSQCFVHSIAHTDRLVFICSRPLWLSLSIKLYKPYECPVQLKQKPGESGKKVKKKSLWCEKLANDFS